MKDAQAKTIYLKDYQVPDFLIEKTFLNFELFEDVTIVSSRLLMSRNPAAKQLTGPLILSGQELELKSIVLDGKKLSENEYQVDADTLSIYEVPENFVLEVKVLILPQENTSLEGLYKSKKMFCTQCEAEGFRKITYYLDRPDVLSSFTTRVEGDKKRYPVLLSNGNKIDSGDGADAGRHWAVWEDPFKKPCYLFALVAGDLNAIEDTFTTCSGREIALQIFVEKKDLDKCDFAMVSLKKAMQWDEEVFGREYDLDIFMIVAVDDFNMGAMENKGLNIFNSSCVLASSATSTDFAFQRIEAIVAHEYFHNWSGNRVTCRDWFQLSLKEGFTVFRDAEFSSDMGSRTVKRVEDVSFLRTIQFAEDAGPMAHSIRPDSFMEISNFYTVTIYEKGAEVVRMIANLLGPELFRKGTDSYFEKYDGMAVTTEDFVSTMEEVSSIDLTQFRRWYSQAGTPELSVTATHDAANSTYTLSVKQSCPATPGQELKEPFYIPMTIGLLDQKGNELPLTLVGDDEPAATPGINNSKSKVLIVDKEQQDFVFSGISDKPVPSLLRGFSAPVKLHMDYSREQLVFLITHDSDGFVRWEASQQLGLQILDELLLAHQQGKALEVDSCLISSIKAVLDASLNDPSLDKAMVANLILLPSEAYISETATEIDVDGIHLVREFIRKQIALSLEDTLIAVYQANIDNNAYEVNADAIAQRSLKNTVLNYLMLLEQDKWAECCYEQYQNSDNMTDVSAALRALVNSSSPSCTSQSEKALAEFYENWKHEPLVVEQWLAMQASAAKPDNLSVVKALTEHEAFDIKNPNKVRSVISAFCNQNLVGFHRQDGEGYAFLAGYVITLNALNPQIASRLLTPLTRWKKHNAARQGLMKAQLQRIMDVENLSKDVYEVVSKSL